MRKILFLLLIAVPLASFSQNKETKEKLQRYQEQGIYTVDGNDIVVSAVFENVPGTKVQIYNKVKSYFTRTYKDASTVLQIDDKEGGLVTGKGLYSELYKFSFALTNPARFSAYHIIRVDIKDGRVRVICSANEWVVERGMTVGTYRKDLYTIGRYYPFTDKGILSNKGKTADAFLTLVDRLYYSVSSLEAAVRDGGVSGENNDDW